jgi:hypothetical protein
MVSGKMGLMTGVEGLWPSSARSLTFRENLSPGRGCAGYGGRLKAVYPPGLIRVAGGSSLFLEHYGFEVHDLTHLGPDKGRFRLCGRFSDSSGSDRRGRSRSVRFRVRDRRYLRFLAYEEPGQEEQRRQAEDGDEPIQVREIVLPGGRAQGLDCRGGSRLRFRAVSRNRPRKIALLTRDGQSGFRVLGIYLTVGVDAHVLVVLAGGICCPAVGVPDDAGFRCPAREAVLRNEEYEKQADSENQPEE